VLDLHEEIPPLRIDPLQIQQAIIHLILNAVEASPPETAVTVRTRLSAEAGTVELTVADAGRGMSEEELDRIFDPFFTTKELGTGLGLAITHGIIEQHGGTISVNSRRGEGTAMTLRLPTPPQNEH
jgi:two-component system NtrC family sensor kinase